MKDILDIYKGIKIPKITDKREIIVPHTLKTNSFTIGKLSDYFIKERLFEKYSGKIFQYNLYWNSNKTTVDKGVVVYQHKTENDTHEKLINIKNELKLDINFIEQHINNFKLSPNKNIEVSKQCAIEVYEIINHLDLNLFKPKDYIFLNPLLGSEIISNFHLNTHDKIAMPDLIVDDILIEIKSDSKLEFKLEYFFQLIEYLIWFELSREFNDFAKPISKIGIYFSRFNYLHIVELSSIFSSDELSKMISFGKSLIKAGIRNPSSYISNCHFFLNNEEKLIKDYQKIVNATLTENNVMIEMCQFLTQKEEKELFVKDFYNNLTELHSINNLFSKVLTKRTKSK